ncbi:MAG: ribonuclease H family protein [Bacteroidales bacterium]|nr:ribonuclease H family protein [Bacteroidales bacterium]
MKRKFYVVWNGVETGIFDSWEECKMRVAGYPNARYKSFDNLEAAVEAYRGSPEEHLGVLKAIASHTPTFVNYHAIPDIVFPAIAVDAACSKNPGPVEYRGVDIDSGQELFHVGPLAGGTNNIGEYLALIHVLALLEKQGRPDITIYSDSHTAINWLRNRHSRSQLTPTADNGYILHLLERADHWIQTHHPTNRVVKWDTDQWGEIPADFGRK